jgi:hypothetical protein
MLHFSLREPKPAVLLRASQGLLYKSERCRIALGQECIRCPRRCNFDVVDLGIIFDYALYLTHKNLCYT